MKYKLIDQKTLNDYLDRYEACLNAKDTSLEFPEDLCLTKYNMNGLDFSNRTLTGIDLSYSCCINANFSGTDLRCACLRGVDCTGADFSNANLSGANLYAVSLRNTKLDGIKLSANLYGTAYGKFAVGSFGQAHAVAAGGYITIGCEHHTFEDWLENGVMYGRTNGWLDKDIDIYMGWIKLAIRSLEQE